MATYYIMSLGRTSTKARVGYLHTLDNGSVRVMPRPDSDTVSLFGSAQEVTGFFNQVRAALASSVSVPSEDLECTPVSVMVG